MGAVMAAAVLLATLQACSTVDDDANPVEWYKSLRDWINGDDANKEAKKAVRRWRYEPALKDGEPIDAYFTVRVEFELK